MALSGSFGGGGSPSSGTYAGTGYAAGDGYRRVYSIISYPTGNGGVNIDGVSINGSISCANGFGFYFSSNGHIGIFYVPTASLFFQRYIGNGINVYDSADGDYFGSNNSGGLQGSYTWSCIPGRMGTVTTATASTTVSGRINLGWSTLAVDNVNGDGGNAISGYTITNVTTGGTKTVNTSSANWFVDGLTPGTNYQFRVAATNARGTGASSTTASTAVMAPGNPNPPTGLNAVTSTTALASVNLEWTAPAVTAGNITGYNVFATPSGGSRVQIARLTGTGVTYSGSGGGSFASLVANTSYTFDVTARNAFSDANSGQSLASTTATAFASGIPGALTGLTLTPGVAGTNEITATWVAPTNTGRPAGITAYDLYWYRNSIPATVFSTTLTGSPPASTSIVGALSPAAAYTFYVRARNALATTLGTASVSSAEVSATAPPDPQWSDNLIADTMRLGTVYSDSVLAEPVEGETVEYSVSSGSLPSGINLNIDTGVISGTPDALGAYTFQVTGTYSNVLITPIVTTISGTVRPGGNRFTAPGAGNSIKLSTMKRKNASGGWTDITFAQRKTATGWEDLS
jgi:titin